VEFFRHRLERAGIRDEPAKVLRREGLDGEIQLVVAVEPAAFAQRRGDEPLRLRVRGRRRIRPRRGIRGPFLFAQRRDRRRRKAMLFPARLARAI